jgi:hypothetical protein
MNKRDALRLQPGQLILYSDRRDKYRYDPECGGEKVLCAPTYRGEVMHVTPAGAIRVRAEDGAPSRFPITTLCCL